MTMHSLVPRQRGTSFANSHSGSDAGGEIEIPAEPLICVECNNAIGSRRFKVVPGGFVACFPCVDVYQLSAVAVQESLL